MQFSQLIIKLKHQNISETPQTGHLQPIQMSWKLKSCTKKKVTFKIKGLIIKSHPFIQAQINFNQRLGKDQSNYLYYKIFKMGKPQESYTMRCSHKQKLLKTHNFQFTVAFIVRVEVFHLLLARRQQQLWTESFRIKVLLVKMAEQLLLKFLKLLICQ